MSVPGPLPHVFRFGRDEYVIVDVQVTESIDVVLGRCVTGYALARKTNAPTASPTVASDWLRVSWDLLTVLGPSRPVFDVLGSSTRKTWQAKLVDERPPLHHADWQGARIQWPETLRVHVPSEPVEIPLAQLRPALARVAALIGDVSDERSLAVVECTVSRVYLRSFARPDAARDPQRWQCSAHVEPDRFGQPRSQGLGRCVVLLRSLLDVIDGWKLGREALASLPVSLSVDVDGRALVMTVPQREHAEVWTVNAKAERMGHHLAVQTESIRSVLGPLQRAAAHASTDANRPALTSIYVTRDADDSCASTVRGCDGFRQYAERFPTRANEPRHWSLPASLVHAITKASKRDTVRLGFVDDALGETRCEATVVEFADGVQVFCSHEKGQDYAATLRKSEHARGAVYVSGSLPAAAVRSAADWLTSSTYSGKLPAKRVEQQVRVEWYEAGVALHVVTKDTSGDAPPLPGERAVVGEVDPALPPAAAMLFANGLLTEMFVLLAETGESVAWKTEAGDVTAPLWASTSAREVLLMPLRAE